MKHEPLTQQEIDALIEAARSPLEQLLVSLLYVTGARVSELLRIRPRDIEFERTRVRVMTLKRREPGLWRFCALWDPELLKDLRGYCARTSPRTSLFSPGRGRRPTTECGWSGRRLGSVALTLIFFATA